MTELTSYLTSIGSIFDAIFAFFTKVLNLYVTNPVLAIVFTMSIIAFVAAVGQRMVARA